MPEATIVEMLAAARRDWPTLDVPDEAFVAFLERVCPDAGARDSLNASDVYLACACAAGSVAAIAAFEQRYVGRVAAYLGKVEHDAGVVDDVQQALRLHVLMGAAGRPGRIADYSGRGSLASWVRVVTLRLHASMRRRAPKDGPSDRPIPEAVGLSPELAVLRARYLPVVENALRQSITALAPRERAVLRMHFIDGLSLERIGDLYGVHKATVSRWLSAARNDLLAFATDRLSLESGVARDELESLLGLLGSELNVSLTALLDAEVPRAS